MPGLTSVGSPFWSPDIARQNSLAALLRGNAASMGADFRQATLPQFDWANMAQKQNMQNQQNMLTSLQNYQNPYGKNGSYMGQGGFSAAEMADIRNSVNQAKGGGGGYGLNALLRALGAQESGNRYGARNSSSGAMGRWQVMPANIVGGGGWDMEAIRRNISTGQFMSNPALQNAIVRYKFGNYLKKYGAKGALSAWYSGDPNKWKYSKGPQSGGPSVYNYVMQVLNRL